MPVPEPRWELETVPLPELVIERDLVRLTTGLEARLTPPLPERGVSPGASTRYDEPPPPCLDVEFDV